MRMRDAEAEAERHIVIKFVHEEECAVVMVIITLEPVYTRRLRTHRHQCRVPARSTHQRIKTGIRNTEHAYLAVVIRQVLYQPVYSVPAVCCFIYVFIGFLIVIVWAHVHELAFAHPPATHILYHHYVVLLQVCFLVGAPEVSQRVFAIRRTGIWGTCKQYRVRFRIIIRKVYRSEQPGTITHGDVLLQLGIVLHHPHTVASAGMGRCHIGNNNK